MHPCIKSVFNIIQDKNFVEKKTLHLKNVVQYISLLRCFCLVVFCNDEQYETISLFPKTQLYDRV